MNIRNKSVNYGGQNKYNCQWQRYNELDNLELLGAKFPCNIQLVHTTCSIRGHVTF